MSSHTIKFALLLGVVALAAFAGIYFGIPAFSQSRACHGEVRVRLQSSFGVLSADESKAYLLMHPRYARPAVGICAFPDGGTPLTLHESLDLYEVDLLEKKAILKDSIDRARIANFMIGLGSDIIMITHKAPERMYAVVGGQAADSFLPQQVFIEVDLAAGTMRRVSGKDAYDKVTQGAHRIQESFDFGSRGKHVAFERQQVVLYPGLPRGTPEVLLAGYDWLPYTIRGNRVYPNFSRMTGIEWMMPK